MQIPLFLSKIVLIYIVFLRLLAGVSMAIIVIVMLTQVWFRYVGGGSLIWAEELCRYLLIWQTFLVLGLAYSKGEFVALDFLPAALSERGTLVLKTITAIPVMAFLILITIYGADYASLFSNQTIPALDFIWRSLSGRSLGLSINYVYISVSVGSALMLLHVIADILWRFGLNIKGLQQGAPRDADEVSETDGRLG